MVNAKATRIAWLHLVEKVSFDKMSDFREMYKMTFSLPRRRTKVLREGKKRSKQCQNRTKFDALYDFLPIHFKLIILRFLYLLKRLLFLCVYRQSVSVSLNRLTDFIFMGLYYFTAPVYKGAEVSIIKALFHFCNAILCIKSVVENSENAGATAAHT